MLHPSTQQLIRKLCELTESNAIAWKEGEGGRYSVFETEGYIVEIEAEPPAVRLKRADGRELERADAADLARGAETAISKILSALSAPPQAPPKPEPEPAALAFDAASPPASSKPAAPMRSHESDAALAAVNADLDSQRRRMVEDPPVSHVLAAPAPLVTATPETETAIDRVLAVQAAPPQELPNEPPPPVAQAREPVKAEPLVVQAAEPAPPPVIETPPEPAPLQAGPDPVATPAILASVTAPVALEPVAAAPLPRPQPAPTPDRVELPKPGFGAIDGFARAVPSPQPAQMPAATPEPKREPKPEPSKMTSAGLLVSGFSARSRQTPESATAASGFLRPPTPRPPPAPAPVPAPSPPPEKKLEPAAATGADIYKPWT